MNLKNINIAVIGAGRIAHSLIPAMQKAGFKVSAVISRKIDSSKKLAEKNNIEFYSDDLSKIPPKINFFILALPDSEIKEAAKKLSMQKINYNNKTFIHLSGSQNISSLKALKEKGADTGSIHIMQSFPSKRAFQIKNSFAAIEAGKPEVKKILFQFAEKLGLNSFEIKSKDKILDHLIGVYASNFLASNLFIAESLFATISGGKGNFYSVVQPIILSTLKNIKNFGAASAISGPVARGEVEVVKSHLKELKKLKNKALIENYKAQSLFLISVIEKKEGKLSEGQKEIKRILLM